VGKELATTKRNGKRTAGGGPHRGMVGCGAVSVNAGAEEWHRSSTMWTKGMGCLATRFEALEGQGVSRVEELRRGCWWLLR
jgi:hypothetical protein